MAVQFVGDTLRLPIVNKPDMDKPFGSSELEREVRRIVVNPFSDNPQTFVPEAENDRLREVVSDGEENARFILQESRALQAENAKLRELVADTLMQPRDYCQKYDIEYDSWDSVNEHLDARLRELGVEVEP